MKVTWKTWPRYLFSRDRMKVVHRLLSYQKLKGKIRLGVFELALLVENAWNQGLDSEEIDTDLNYYEAKRELEEKGHA